MGENRITGRNQKKLHFFEEETLRPKKTRTTRRLAKQDYKTAEKDAKESLLIQNLGDSILRGLLSSFTDTNPSGEGKGASGNLADVHKAMEVAAKMAVSREDIGQPRMCQITIGKESVLAGTEIRIFQEAGVLQFQFFIRTDGAAHLFSQGNALTNLQRFLQKRLKTDNINIDILDERGDERGGRSGR